MLAYEFLDRLADIFCNGNRRKFENQTGLRDGFLVYANNQRSLIISEQTKAKIEHRYSIKILQDDNDYLGYRKGGRECILALGDPDVTLAEAKTEEELLVIKHDLKVIVHEFNTRIDDIIAHL